MTKVSTVAFALLSLVACGRAEDDPWWLARSPDEEHAAAISMRFGDVGGDTTTVSIYEIVDGWKMDWNSETVVFRIHQCSVLHVFWKDSSTLEVVLDPRDHDCEGRAPLVHRDHPEVALEVTRPVSVRKENVLSAQPFPLPPALHDRGALPTAFAASGPASAAGVGRLGVPKESLRLVLDHAEARLVAGELDDALHLFELADRFDVHEVPSYEGLIGWAEALCRKGKVEHGAALLRDFRCTLAVDSAALPCYIGAPTAGAPGEPNPALTEGCFERMCGEAYLTYYEHPTPETLAWVAKAEERARRVERLCGREAEADTGEDPSSESPQIDALHV